VIGACIDKQRKMLKFAMAEAATQIKEQVRIAGWAFLPAPHGIDWPILAQTFGIPVATQIARDLVLELRPRSKSDAPKGTMSSFVGYSAQPMHTDAAYYPLPPRYVILTCINAGESTCPTHLWILNWRALLHDRPQILAKHI
jgi:hypothetical protein